MSKSLPLSYGPDPDAEPLEFTGERFVPGVRGDIEVEHVHRYLFARQFVADCDVLDIACGEGYGSSLLAGRARSVTGVDIDEAVIRRAAGVHIGPNVQFVVGRCTEIPLEDNSFDVVVSFETIEHISEHEAFVNEIRRVLRPGGVVIMSTPDPQTYLEGATAENPFHVREMDRQEFIDLMAQQFGHARFGVQRCVTGSVLVPLDGESPMTTPGLHRLDSAAGLIHDDGKLADRGVFLVGLASDRPLPTVDWSLLDDPSFALAEQVGLQHRVASLEGSVMEYEVAMRKTLDELQSVRRSLAVRVAARLGLIPRGSDTPP